MPFEDDVLGVIREVSPGAFTFRVTTTGGAVRGHFWVGAEQIPSTAQVNLMRWAIQEADEIKRLVVAFVRNKVLTQPDRYGLLEEDGSPTPWAAPYFNMSESEYFDDFRLESLEIEGRTPTYIRMTYATELDPEHGVPVLFQEGQPVEAFA